MKRILLLSMCFVLLLCGCASTVPQSNTAQKSAAKAPQNINGVWISYIELDSWVKSGNINTCLENAVNNCAEFGITDIFLHTVAFCDAIYPSSVYPVRNAELCRGTDILAYAVKLCRKSGIRLHAWINPYRVSTAANGTVDDRNSPAYKWLNDNDPANDKNVLFCERGIYLNPAEAAVRETVISAVRELCLEYKIDGVHFDDYFYPVTDAGFDAESYKEYIAKTGTPLDLGDFRRAGVNALISGCYTAVKFINKNIVFSVSPAADIAKNRESRYADVAAWCESGCVDAVIPQLYFGYEYRDKNFCFDTLLENWKKLTGKYDVRLCAGLGFYKTGTVTEADGSEWSQRDDIISRQTACCLGDPDISGQVYYSYSSLFSKEELNTRAREKTKKVLCALKNN